MKNAVLKPYAVRFTLKHSSADDVRVYRCDAANPDDAIAEVCEERSVANILSCRVDRTPIAE